MSEMSITTLLKKTYPFGTPQHGKHAYSDFAHLTGDNKNFAMQIAASDSTQDVKPILHQSENINYKKKVAVPDMPQVEEGIKPCLRPECREVIAAIQAAQEKNQRERDDILGESKRLITDLQQTDQLIGLTEGEQKQCVSESSQIENNLSQLHDILDNLEKIKQQQEKERDELNNKVMMLEAEKQRWTGRLQRAEAALADMLWKGISDSDGHSKSEQSLLTNTQINFSATKPPKHSMIHSESECDSLSYYSLVSDSNIDTCERSTRDMSESLNRSALTSHSHSPTNHNLNSSSSSSIPNHPMDFIQLMKGSSKKNKGGGGGGSVAGSRSMSSLTQRKLAMMSSNVDWNTSPLLKSTLNSSHSSNIIGNGNNTNTSHKHHQSTTISNNDNLSATSGSKAFSSTQKKRPITNPSDGSLILGLAPGSYRGYTPSGSSSCSPHKAVAKSSYHPSSTTASSLSVSSLGDFSSATSTWQTQTLDPVFFAEEARVSWGRHSKTGSVRVRHDPPGFRRKMLTANGHPGIYKQGEFDEDSLDSLSFSAAAADNNNNNSRYLL